MRMSRRNLIYIFLSAVVAASLMAAPAKAKKAETGFLDRTVNVAGTEYKYQVFVPETGRKNRSGRSFYSCTALANAPKTD